MSNDSFNLIKSTFDNNRDKRILIHFDDYHEASHVLKELKTYAPLLKTNDIIIVGDTWDEGWYNSPFQALCNFLENDNTMYIDIDLNSEMFMPCNWVFGILIKK